MNDHSIHTMASLALTRVNSADVVVAKRSPPHTLHPRTAHSTLHILLAMCRKELYCYHSLNRLELSRVKRIQTSSIVSLYDYISRHLTPSTKKYHFRYLPRHTLYRRRRMLLLWAVYAQRSRTGNGGIWPSLSARPLLPPHSLRLQGECWCMIGVVRRTDEDCI